MEQLFVSVWLGNVESVGVRFGMFGLAKAVPASIGFNYIGIVILIIGALMYSLVKNTPQKQPGQDEAKENEEVR
ncbi:unnamed protein product [Cylicostephanus goldi]|uniref:Uncharacterized protein n=1 Tax=Cylicostephanus goldi TaxID=71465 RepID=A0A3P6U9V8_CYLGO|nr:unnamed protein product [Cylicostephanus goldi]